MDTSTKVAATVDRDRVRSIYFRLEAMWHSLEPHQDGNVIDGPLALFINTTEELSELTQVDYSPYIPDKWSTKEGKQSCAFADLKIQVSALLGELRSVYVPESIPHFIKQSQAEAANISSLPQIHLQQNVQQNVTFQQTLIDIAGKLEQATSTAEVGSKKRTFFEKLKTVLYQAKDYASLMALMVQTAQSIELPMNELSEVLQSLGLG